MSPMATHHYQAICLGSQSILPLVITKHPMESITSINLHRFGDGLLVEVVGNGPDEEISVRSFELEFVDDEAGIVRPRAPLSSADRVLILDRIMVDGYRFATAPTSGFGDTHPESSNPIRR